MMAYADFIRGLGRYPTWIIIVIYLSQVRNLSYIEVGLIFLISSAISFPINIIGGTFIDKVGRRGASLMVPLLVTILYFALFISIFLNLSILLILIEFISTGVLSSIQWVVINAIVTDNTEPFERLDAFSALRILGNLGIGAGLVMAGLISAFQSSYFFIVPAFGSLIEFIIFVKYIPESKPIGTEKHTDTHHKLKVYGDKLLIIITVVLAISMLFANQWETPTLPLYLTRFLGIQTTFITVLYAINTAVVVLFQYRLNVIAERIGYVRSFSIGLLFYSLSFIVFGLTGDLVILAFNVVILTVGESMTNPFFSVTISRIAPKDRRGEYFGFTTSIFGIIGTFSPFMGTLFLTFFFNPPIEMWLLLSLATFIMAILALLTRERILNREREIAEETSE
ncbi:MAG: MFS transporter [Thermoplasmataceae archaeon]